MTTEQVLILAILLATVAMFLWGRWRHDMVAAGALLACVLAGLVQPTEAFAGFGHPAVITVACVLVLSRGLQTSGAVDAVTRVVLPSRSGPTVSIAALTALAAVLSAFMNNVGALALLMPVAIQVAKRQQMPPGQVLMPLAFGSILGGMTTLIGTPPNLIVSGFRGQTGADTFAMFDFAPVGVVVAAVGVAFVALLGWRLVPARRQGGVDSFDAGAYLTEARVPEGSKAAGRSLREIEALLEETGAQVVGLVRNDVRVTAPNPGRRVRAGDILVIEAEADALANTLSALGLRLEEAKEVGTGKDDSVGDGGAGHHAPADTDAEKREDEDGVGADGEAVAAGDDIVLIELAVLPGSALTGRSASDILLRTRYGINLLALSRQGQRSLARLRSLTFQAGDLLLMQGPSEAVAEFASNYGCVPLAERELRIPDRRRALTAGAIMAVAVGGAAFGLVPAAVSFAAGVLASMALRTVPPRAVYEAIDWPVIVLLAALIPVAGAMESTGTADLVARVLIENVAHGHAIFSLALILVVTMTLSDLMNNAATAAVMCPIAIGTAGQLGVSADPFLMAVAVGASCAFLTPIGHQNNTLILGPGGFRFGDYWPLGLPLEILVIAVGLPMLLVVWPL
ncbi:MAG: SLC13 family permease [Rehaibacterium terrae]|uniref:SLC13 family permease n=1 Tax=Rehaibacterium terrae TaxID=1341696 RepID=UPI00391990D9